MNIKKQGKLKFRADWKSCKQRLTQTFRKGLSGWVRFYVRRRLLVGVFSFLLLLAIGWGIGRQITSPAASLPLVVKEASISPEAETADLETLVRELQADLSVLREKIDQKNLVESGEGTAPVKMVSPLQLISPVEGKVTRQSGWEKKANEWRYHSGVDLSVPTGTRVVAAAAGTVGSIKTDPALGTIVVIDHGNDWRSLYGHLTGIQVSVGQEITQGELLGYSSRASCGPEPGIHFNLYHQENPVDPLTMLSFPQD